MKTIGILLVAFGLVDLLGSYFGLNIWLDWLGVNLTGLVDTLSAWAEIGIGYGLIKLSGGSDEGVADDEQPHEDIAAGSEEVADEGGSDLPRV